MSDKCLRCDREIQSWSGTRNVKREALCDACNEELDELEDIEREEAEKAWRWPEYRQLALTGAAPTPDAGPEREAP